MQKFVLPYAPDAARMSLVDRNGHSVRVVFPCSKQEADLIKTVTGVDCVPAPAAPKPKDGEE